MKAIQLSLIACLLWGLSACSQNIETSGTYLLDAQVGQISRGMSAAQVRERLGAPSYISAVDPDFWAYIGTRLEVRLFQNPLPIERRILALDVSGGVVRDLVQISLQDGQQIYPNPDRTPTNGRTITLTEELLGSVRRF